MMPRKKRIINPKQIRVDLSTLEKVKRNLTRFAYSNHDTTVSKALDYQMRFDKEGSYKE